MQTTSGESLAFYVPRKCGSQLTTEAAVRNVIRLGDTTTHGGKVISTRANHFKVGGIPVACMDDACSCPIPGHDGCTIASGSKRHRIRR